jgi:uncharacterized protein
VTRARLNVYVTPRSGRDEVAGWRGGELSVRVTSAPEDGKANAAVCRVLAAALGVPRSSVKVVRGQTSRHKLVEVDGVDADTVRGVFGQPGDSLS